MENISIENTKSTPKVIGNTESCSLIMSGNLFPENSIIFFKPIPTSNLLLLLRKELLEEEILV